jgi:hypothetical protein
MSISQATAAPMAVNINGREYLFSPLTIGDYGRLESHVKSKIVNIAMSQAHAVPDKTIRQELINAALDKANRIALYSNDPETQKESQGFLNSIDCITQLLYLSLKKNHKDLTVDDVEQLLDSTHNAEELSQIVNAMSGLPAEDEQPQKKVNQAAST